VLAPVGNSDGDTQTDIDSETATELLRIPMALPVDFDPELLIVPRNTNTEDIQGFWYPYSHDDQSLQMAVIDENTVCLRGELSASSLTIQPWGGMGFALCFTDAAAASPWSITPLSTCPYGNDLMDRLMGVSFVVEGTVPSESLYLHFKEQGDQNPARIKVAAFGQRADYLMAAAEHPPETSLIIETLTAVQLHLSVPGAPSEVVDFCMSDLEILLRR
jgi:hypothetical protein